jgi:acetamidase/formamidase
MAEHYLKAGSKAAHWGFFDAQLAPVLTVASGDTVTIETVSGNADFLPDAEKFEIPPALTEIHTALKPRLGPHILTGPVAVEGAKPGDVLEVRIRNVELLADWGYNMIRPLMGALPDDFDAMRRVIIPLDRKRKTGRMPWGLELKLNPFFGVMGIAPPPGWGAINSVVPRANGGNLDNKELGAGATLFLPVFQDGALFSCGDGHGVQGDGEVCVTAIETSLRGTFEFIVRKDLTFRYPRAETPTHYITMGMDPDLDQCMVMALRDMIVLLGEKGRLSREDAYTLCSLAADLRVTQAVNGSRGIHAMIEKAVVHP